MFHFVKIIQSSLVVPSAFLFVKTYSLKDVVMQKNVNELCGCFCTVLEYANTDIHSAISSVTLLYTQQPLRPYMQILTVVQERQSVST